MNLIKRTTDPWESFDLVKDLQEDMSRLFRHSLTGHNNWPKTFEPNLEVREEADKYLVHADVPGMKKEEIEILVQRNLLTLKGERKRETETKQKDYYYSERVFGAFSRTIELPTEVDTGKVTAAYKDGVIEITLPKSENAKPKQIKVDLK